MVGNFSKSIGIRIREIRKKRGLTQADLAKAIGRSQQAIVRYETGEALDLDTVAEVSEALTTNVHSLLCSEDDPVKVIARLDLSHIPISIVRLLSHCHNSRVLEAVEALLLGFEDAQKSHKK